MVLNPSEKYDGREANDDRRNLGGTAIEFSRPFANLQRDFFCLTESRISCDIKRLREDRTADGQYLNRRKEGNHERAVREN